MLEQKELVVAVVRRYCIEDAVINYNLREPLFEDNTRNVAFDKVYEDIDLKKELCKINDFKKIGKDISCDVEKLFYLAMLAEYFEIIKETTVCGSDTTFEAINTEYKLDCIRDTLTCNYGLGNLVDELITLLDIRPPYGGIGYMTISLDDCEAFIIY